MRKIWLALGLILGISLGVVYASGQQFNFAGNETGTNTNHAFGFVASKVLIVNDGAASIWASFTTCVAVATSSGGQEIKAGEKFTISIDKNETGWNCVGIITGGGSVATRVNAYKNQ
jgi:hypothetical protein